MLGPSLIATSPSCRFSMLGSDPLQRVDYAWFPISTGSAHPLLPALNSVLSDTRQLVLGWDNITAPYPGTHDYVIGYRTRPAVVASREAPRAPGVGSDVIVRSVASFCPLALQYLRWPRSQELVLDAQPAVDVPASRVPFVWSCVRGDVPASPLPCFSNPTRLNETRLRISPGYLLAGQSNVSLAVGGVVLSTIHLQAVSAEVPMTQVQVRITNPDAGACHTCAARRIRLICNAQDPEANNSAPVTSYQWSILPSVAGLAAPRGNTWQLEPASLQDGAWYYVSCCASTLKGVGCAVNVLQPAPVPRSGECGSEQVVWNGAPAYRLSCSGWIGAIGPVSFRWMRADGSPLGAGPTTANTVLTTSYSARYRVQVSDGRECHSARDVEFANSASAPPLQPSSSEALARMEAARLRGVQGEVLEYSAFLVGADRAAGALIVAQLVAAAGPQNNAAWVRDVAFVLQALAPLNASLVPTVEELARRLGASTNPEHDAVRAQALAYLTVAVVAPPLRQLLQLRDAVTNWTLPGLPVPSVTYEALPALTWVAWQDTGPTAPFEVDVRGNGAVLVANSTLGTAADGSHPGVPQACGAAAYLLVSAPAAIHGPVLMHSDCAPVANASRSCWLLSGASGRWTQAQGCTACDTATAVCCRCPWAADTVAMVVSQLPPPPLPATLAPALVRPPFTLGLGTWSALAALGAVAAAGAVLLALLYWQQRRRAAHLAFAPLASVRASGADGASDEDDLLYTTPAARGHVGVASVPAAGSSLWWAPAPDKKEL